MNDGATMRAWAEHTKVGLDGEGSMINMLADPTGEFTDAMGLRMMTQKSFKQFGAWRSKRYAAYFDKGVCKFVNVCSFPPEDESGDENPFDSMADQVLEDIEKAQTEK